MHDLNCQANAVMPHPPRSPLTLAVGTGSVFMALSQGSGELVWWPYLVAKYGLAFVFLLLPACLLQYPVSYAVARYSLLTGESIFRGFYRYNRHIAGLLWFCFTASFLWFGAYIMTGATALAKLFPVLQSAHHDSLLWSIVIVCLYCGLLLTRKSVYLRLERIMMIVAAATVALLGMALLQPTARQSFSAFLPSILWPPHPPPDWESSDKHHLITALLFAGLGGFWSLFHSYWILAKRLGMAANGENEFDFRNGRPGALTREGERMWRRFLHLHVGIGILGNYATTLCMCALAFAFLTPTRAVPVDWGLAVVQGACFSELFGGRGTVIFLTIAALFLIDTWVTALDSVARVHADMLLCFFPDLRSTNPRSLYNLIGLVLFAITILTMFWAQPATLLLANGVVSAGAMSCIVLLVYLANFMVLKDHTSAVSWIGLRFSLLASSLLFGALFICFMLA